MLKVIKIGDLIKQKKAHSQTGPFGTQLKASDYVDEGIPVINVRNIGFGEIRENLLEYLDDEMASNLKSHRLTKNDIVFGRKGAVERHSLISSNEEGWIQGSDCIRLRFLNSEYNPSFISYFFRTEQHKQWMINLGSFGATIGSLNQAIIYKIEIPDLSLPIQNKIASILSSYDELIENNKHRIKLLETMAEEIYKEWFVRLRFPGYENTKIVDGLPDGWEKMRLDNVLETVKRKPKISTDKYLSEGKYPIIDQGDDFIGGYTNDESLVQFDPLPLLVFGDHTRRIKFVDYPFVSGADGTQLLSPKNKDLLPIYFYISVKNIDLSNFHYARHFKFLKQEYITIPDETTLSKFNNLLSPFFEEIQILKDKNELLQETRDLLLPRLISGKLSVEHLIEEELKMVAEPKSEYIKSK